MAAFQRPGTQKASAFGISFEADRDNQAEPAVLPSYNRNEHLALRDQRQRLPVAAHRKQILYLLENHGVVIVVGETGSGKTTQIPQYLHEAGWTQGGRVVACTQPRRVAAMTVAARVAQEMGVPLGQDVGYAIRFEDVSTKGKTHIKYCTDGVLLREMMSDPLLTNYSVVMVDEAHERSLATDVLLGLLKKVRRRRPDLRVIISSATLEARKFRDFFDAASVRRTTGRPVPAGAIDPTPALLSVEGRCHHVQVHYLEQPCADYVRTAVQAAVDIHLEDLPGDILIFLTGQEECEAAVGLLGEEARRLKAANLALRLLPAPLYAGLPAANQLAALQPPPRGFRKVVVATNIAETSVTIEGVVYVVDCCYAKQRLFDPLTGLEALLVAPASKASATQRAGRAGRVRPGHALRLCSQDTFLHSLPDTGVPEMQRSELAGTVLQLKALGIDNIMRFDWLAPPPAETMVRALELLHALGALDRDAKLSRPIGAQLAELPLEPRLGRALLASAHLGCSQEALTIVAMLSVQSVWAGGRGQRKALDEAKARFAVAEGDLITYLNVWRGWQEAGRDRRWAGANRVNQRTMLRAADIRAQLSHHLTRLGLSLASCGADMVLVRKAFAAGLFTNAAQLVATTVEVTLAEAHDTAVNQYSLARLSGPDGKDVRLRTHPSSVLWRVPAKWVLFCSVQQGDSGWHEMQDLVTIEPEWLAELAPHMYSLRKGVSRQA